jgi:hypothetical protein
MFKILIEPLSTHQQDQAKKNCKWFIMYVTLLIIFITDGFSQSTGFILIKSNPSGAEVIINGKSTFKKTTFQMPMEEGTYNIELKLDMYHQYKENITVRKGQTVAMDIVLKPEFGTITINSEPEDADIVLDAVKTNKKTPATITNVVSGKHIITLLKDMYATSSQELIVNDEQITEKFIELQPDYGTLSIISKPDAEILIDGNTKGTGNKVFLLSPGLHKIVLSADKYFPFTKEITIKKGEEEILDVQLNLIFGSLSVMVDPPETEIYINGKYYGKSPKIIDSLAIGNYNLSLKKDGYAISTQPLLIQEGNTTTITASLQRGKLIKISSSPDGAEIIYNDKPAGITPAEFIVKDGTNNIVLRKKYYLEKLVTIYPEKDYQTFNFNLDADSKFENLGISIETSPNRANIKFNKVEYPEPLPSFAAENQGTYSGVSPLNINVPIGKYNINIGKEHFKTIEKDVFIDKEQNLKFNLEPLKYRTKGNAILLSILWPGAGQSYLNRGGATFLMGFAGYGLLAGAIVESMNFTENNDHYLNEPSKDLANKCKTELNMYYSLLVSAGVVWTTNLIWTIFTPSEEKKYQKLTLNLNYNKLVGITEMGIKMNF